MDGADLIITADPEVEQDALDSALDTLALQLESLGIEVHTQSKPSPAPTKGADVILSLGLSAAALREFRQLIMPLISSWLSRPRNYAVSVELGTGKDRKKIDISATGAAHDKLYEDMRQVAEFIEKA